MTASPTRAFLAGGIASATVDTIDMMTISSIGNAIDFGDLKKGLPVDIDGEAYEVVEYERNKMQKRAPVLRIRLRSYRTGRVLDKTISGYDIKLELASIERKNAEYIYQDADLYYFMDISDFEQFPLTKDQISDKLPYITEGQKVSIIFHNDNPVSIELSASVELKVIEAEPGYKGNTAQGGTKPVKLETGLVINVPLFVEENDILKVDTRNGNYLSRA